MEKWMETLITVICGIAATIALVRLDWKKVWIRIKRFLKLNQKSYEAELSVDNEIRFLSQAVPSYDMKNLKAHLSEDVLYVAIPEEFRARLEAKDFEYREDNLKHFESKIRKAFEHLGIENYLQVINETATLVAADILKILEGGQTRFNGEMLGVKQINTNNIGVKELPKLTIDFYKTDFFTYRVFARIISDYKTRFVVNGIEDLNNFYTPFLSSFGISNYLIISEDGRKYVLFGHRSDRVEVDKNKIHFSMNEAFTPHDINPLDNFQNLSFEYCLKRGFREELGLSDIIQNSHIEQYGFMNVLIDLNKLELGISSFAKLRLDEYFTRVKLKRAYLNSQDGHLETDKLNLVELKNIEEYAIQNKDKMSSSARNLIQSVLSRYEDGYF